MAGRGPAEGPRRAADLDRFNYAHVRRHTRQTMKLRQAHGVIVMSALPRRDPRTWSSAARPIRVGCLLCRARGLKWSAGDLAGVPSCHRPRAHPGARPACSRRPTIAAPVIGRSRLVRCDRAQGSVTGRIIPGSCTGHLGRCRGRCGRGGVGRRAGGGCGWSGARAGAAAGQGGPAPHGGPGARDCGWRHLAAGAPGMPPAAGPPVSIKEASG